MKISMKDGKLSTNFWPLGIVLAFALFIVGTALLIVLAFSQKSDLVSADYYEREIRFQSQIDRVERTRALGSEVAIEYDANSRRIRIAVPAEHAHGVLAGQIELYRPSAARLDRKVKLEPDVAGVQSLDASMLSPGLWKVRVSWTVEQRDYFFDRDLVIGSRAS